MGNKVAVHTQSRGAKAGGRFLALLLSCALIFSLSACLGQKRADLGPVTVEREPEPQTLQTANEATAIALGQYVYARLLTEYFLTAEASAMTAEKLSELADELFLAWENAELFSFVAAELTNQALLLLEASTAQQTSAVGQSQAVFMTLAASDAPKPDPQTWAENLTRQYDALKGAKRYQQLAQQLGTDAKTAYEQMALAQEIIHGGGMEESERLSLMIKVAQTIKTTSKVAMLGWSIVATGGASVGLLEGASLVVGGVDCIADVAETGSTLILGENNQVAVAFGDIKEKLGPVSSLIGLVTLNPSQVGKTAKDTAEAMIYISDSLTDLFYEDKIVGIKVEGLSEQATAISGEMFDVGKKAAVEAAGFLFPATTKTLSQLIELWKPDSEAALARMDALVSQMAELEQRAATTEKVPPEPDSTENTLTSTAPSTAPKTESSQMTVENESIIGTYTLESVYEEIETHTITLGDNGNGSVIWKGYPAGAEMILPYDQKTNAIEWSSDEFEISIVFSLFGGNVTAFGYSIEPVGGRMEVKGISITKISD